VIIIGAGAAGLLAALELRKAGLDCLVLEQGQRSSWASPHCIEIDTSSIQGGVVPAPGRECIVHRGGCGAVLLSPAGARFEVADLPVNLVRHDLYLHQLLAEAVRAGAEVRFESRVVSLERAEGEDRRISVGLESTAGAPALSCDLLVLATGNSTGLDRQLYAHTGLSRKVPAESFVTALHELWSVPVPVGASDVFPAAPGRVAYRVAHHGPFSVEATWVSPSRDLASCLAGTIPGDGNPTPSEVLSGMRERFSGPVEVLSSAGARIPIRRPLDVLAAHGVALIGNAACQVFPATGCGVALAGRAAGLLAEHGASYCRDSRRQVLLWRYGRDYQRQWGAVQAASDVFVRGLRRLALRGWSVADLLMEAGASNGSDFLRSLELKSPVPPAMEWVRRTGAMVRLGPRVGPLSAIMAQALAVQGLYRFGYPEQSDPAAMKRFVARVGRLMG
jgi:flavin-dependent dehydrogenase